MGIKSRTFDIPSISSGAMTNGHSSLNAAGSTALGGGDKKQYRIKLTDEERKRVEDMIRNAKSLQEITRLEREINEGRIPG